MIDLKDHPDCKKCSLWESATHRGIQSRSFLNYDDLMQTRAVLVVGQSPGFDEDRDNKCWIGWAGNLLSKFILASEFVLYCDVYLANACRCRPPQDGKEKQGQIKACRDYLNDDIEQLRARYEEVIIFALGAKACYSVAGLTSLTTAFKKQGSMAKFFPECRAFFSYHPAHLAPSRKPALVRAVEAHFGLVKRYLTGEFMPNTLNVKPELGIKVPKFLSEYVSFDIETYGILKGKDQTVFHPIKSKVIDGVDFKDQIVTVSFAWRDEEQKLRTAEYIFEKPLHRQVIRQWFQKIGTEGHVLLGQNLKFDLLYLSMCGDEVLRFLIDPRWLKIDDTILWNFLWYDQQPEKGLKECSTLFGITDYSYLSVGAKSGQATDAYDPMLHLYNCTDSAVAFLLRELLLRRIKERFGVDSPKLGPVSAWMRNLVLWDVFELERNGSAFDLEKLTAFHNKISERCKQLLVESKEKYGLRIAGTDSDKPLRQFILDCLQESNLLNDPRVEWCKTGKISIGIENVNLIKKHIPEGHNKEVLSMFQEYKEKSKLVSSFSDPILNDPRRGIVIQPLDKVGLTYPSWYPVPSYEEKSHEKKGDDVGGQIQGRFSCKKPARQTEPREIRDCSTSRWPGGSIVEYDVNQDHLRMAALLSGDPLLLDAYIHPSESIHTKTAKTIFPDADVNDPNWKKTAKYQTGKDLNFLVLFHGGADAFRKLILDHTGEEVELDFCQESINKWFEKHHYVKEWQERCIAQAKQQGYITLPTGWSRTFALDNKSIAFLTSEVCNFIVQTPCAQMLHSSMFQTLIESRLNYLRSLLCLQIYDALFVDVYPGEEKAIDEIVGPAIIRPPLLSVIEGATGRSIPWAFERKLRSTV